MKTVYPCPACKKHTYVVHCDNPACTWMKCRNTEECDLVVDQRKGRGHLLGDFNPVTKQRPRVRWAA